MNDYVEEYRNSKQGRKKFLMEYDTHHMERTENWPSDIIHSFFRLGEWVLSTFHYMLSEKIIIMQMVFWFAFPGGNNICGDVTQSFPNRWKFLSGSSGAGTGMKKQVWFGYQYAININHGSGTGPWPRKTLPGNTCITGEVIHRHQVLNMYLLQHQNSEFFIIFNIWWASNQSILSLMLASNTYTWLGHFIYPFGSSIEEKIPVLLGQIQVPILALDSSMIHIPKIC